MALDVYVGSLTRYYGGDWDNTERSRRAPVRDEHPERLMTSEPESSPGVAALELEQAGRPIFPRRSTGMKHPRRRISPAGRAGTVGPRWCCGRPMPSIRCVGRRTLPDEWENDPALARSNAEGFRSRYSHLVRHVELWLPSPFPFTFDGEDVGGRRVVIGSAPTLRRQLADLNGATWKAGDAAVAGWGRKPPPDKAPLELRARYGFAAMVQASQHAVDRRLPMKLDY